MQELSLDLVEGQMVALLGHNGAGAHPAAGAAQQLEKAAGRADCCTHHGGQVQQGQALTGVLLAGKTTALGMLSGLTRPTAGECHIRGHSMLTSPALARQSLGFCPQQNVLFPRLTVLEHLRLYAAIKAVPGGFSGRPAADAAAEMMEARLRCPAPAAPELPRALLVRHSSPCTPGHKRVLRAAAAACAAG